MLSAEAEKKMMRRYHSYSRRLEAMCAPEVVADDAWTQKFIKLALEQASIIDEIYIKKYGQEAYNEVINAIR